MSEMVERLAAYLYRSSYFSFEPEPFEDSSKSGQEDYRNRARLILQELREPTEAMCSALGPMLAVEPPLAVADTWRAMIDAALK